MTQQEDGAGAAGPAQEPEPAALIYTVGVSAKGATYVADILGPHDRHGLARLFCRSAVADARWSEDGERGTAVVRLPAREGGYEVQSWPEPDTKERHYWQVGADGMARAVTRAQALAFGTEVWQRRAAAQPGVGWSTRLALAAVSPGDHRRGAWAYPWAFLHVLQTRRAP